MTKTILTTIVASVWATAIALAQAQTGTPDGVQLNPDRVATSGQPIVIGCVSRDGSSQPPRFIITDTRPQPPVPYRLEGDPALLRFHVGHMLEVAGPVTAATGAGNARTLKVQALTYLSTTCPKP